MGHLHVHFQFNLGSRYVLCTLWKMFKFFLVNFCTYALNTWHILSCRFQLTSRMFLITQLLQHYLILQLMYVVQTISVITLAVKLCPFNLQA